MRLVDVALRGFISVGTLRHHHFLRRKLRQLTHVAEHLLQIRIGVDGGVLQQIAHVIHSRRNAVYEVSLALEVAPEAIGSQHLQRAEEHEQVEACLEVSLGRHLGIVLQRVVVFGDEVAAQLVGIFCRCLPEERCQVVVEWSLAPTLIVDEARLAVHEHHVAGLEVAIQEGIARLCRQVFGQHAEVRLQLQLVEVQSCGLQEAIFKVVQVEEHAVLVELRLRIATAPVQSAGATHLNVRQLANGLHQQSPFLLCVAASSLTSHAQGVEERLVAEVGLQIAQLVVAHGEDLRHR